MFPLNKVSKNRSFSSVQLYLKENFKKIYHGSPHPLKDSIKQHLIFFLMTQGYY